MAQSNIKAVNTDLDHAESLTEMIAERDKLLEQVRCKDELDKLIKDAAKSQLRAVKLDAFKARAESQFWEDQYRGCVAEFQRLGGGDRIKFSADEKKEFETEIQREKKG